jgi:hypothetical protein
VCPGFSWECIQPDYNGNAEMLTYCVKCVLPNTKPGHTKEGKVVSTDEVLSLLKNKPELCDLNADVKQKKVE